MDETTPAAAGAGEDDSGCDSVGSGSDSVGSVDAGASDGGDSGTAVLARDVRKSYGDVVALDGVDLDVQGGEVFGLIGPNGAGKTTLVRALTGTTEAAGRIRVFGDEPSAVDPERVGLLPQSFSPPERLTARELVGYYGGLYEAPREVGAVLDDVGLADDADSRYETLSGGQKRRACVATSLVNDPDVLFLDEPTTGIDPAGSRSLGRLIRELAADGTTVFLTSHAMAEIERLADRVALLRDGAVVAVGTPSGLVADHGGAPHLDVTFGDGVPDRSVLERVGDASPVPVETTDRGVRFTGVDPEGIAGCVDALATAGVGFESLSWSEPTLEDVYLELTGEEYDPRPGEPFETNGGTGVETNAGTGVETNGGTGVETNAGTGVETNASTGTDTNDRSHGERDR